MWVPQKILCLAWFSILVFITQNSKIGVRVMETANGCFQKLRTELWVLKTELWKLRYKNWAIFKSNGPLIFKFSLSNVGIYQIIYIYIYI